MSDLSIKLTAEKLGKSLKNVSSRVEQEMQDAVKNLANAAYASMVTQVQNMGMDPKNRQDYLRGLQFTQIGDNAYMIHLEGDWANKLEDGFPSYSLKEVLLRSQKRVEVGSRAGQKWVREAKDGHKYASVPFEHKPYAAKAGDLAAEIKKMNALNRQGQKQRITKTFKDDFGKPIIGKVATAIFEEGTTPENLKGLTKYQYVSDKGKVSSIYMTFRVVSENSTGWINPGFSGYQLFEQAEREIEKELENIVKTLL